MKGMAPGPTFTDQEMGWVALTTLSLGIALGVLLTLMVGEHRLERNAAKCDKQAAPSEVAYFTQVNGTTPACIILPRNKQLLFPLREEQ